MNTFSDREKKIIKIIGHKKVTLEYISKELFKNDQTFDCNIKVANSVSRIIKKCYHYKYDWTFKKTRVNGKLFIKKEKR